MGLPRDCTSPVGPGENIRLIGRRCRHGDVHSRAVLMAREAWPYHRSFLFPCVPYLCSLRVPVAMAGRKCPFPSRTRKPSSPAPVIVPPGVRKQAAAGSLFFLLNPPPLRRGISFLNKQCSLPGARSRGCSAGGILRLLILFCMIEPWSCIKKNSLILWWNAMC